MTNNHNLIKELISRYKDYKSRNGHNNEFLM